MANFYERKMEDEKLEDLGGFNMELLLEMRNALIDLEEKFTPTKLNESIIELIRTYNFYDFPDDELG